MPNAGVWVELTQGNINNSHIYLREVLSFFPSDAIGGSNAKSASAHPISVEFEAGARVETDIDGEKQFLRARGPIQEFFERNGAGPGDKILISKIGDRSFRFELAKR